MNKLQYIIMLACALLFARCGDDGDTYTVAPDDNDKTTLTLTSPDPNVTIDNDARTVSVIMRASGRDVAIAVETNRREWSLSPSAGSAWLEAARQDDTLILSAAVNADDSERTGTLEVSAGTGEGAVKYTITVTQRSQGDPSLEVDTDEILFTPKDQGAKVVTVTTNQDEWDFRTTTSSYWLLIEKGENTLTLKPDPNVSVVNESIVIELSAGYGDKVIKETITVVNEAEAVILFDPDAVVVTNAGGTQDVRVITNQEWELGDITELWVDATKSGGDKITVTVYPSGEQTDRTYGIPVLCGSGDNVTTGYINVTQWGNASNIMMLEYTIASNNTTITLPLVGTVDCTINWGDGNSQEASAPKPTHTYSSAGTYTVSISGTVTGLSNNGLSSSAKLLTRVLQWGRTGLTSMDGACYECLNLTSIPGDDYESFAEVTTFRDAFYYCPSLTAIPAGLLKYAKKATHFNALFSVSTSATTTITEIPAGLFDNCLAAETFENVFYGRKALTTIPAGLFDNTRNAEYFGYAFAYTSVGTLPAGLFANCKKALSFNSLFYQGALQTIPADLFTNNTEVTDISSAFHSCKDITTIPAGLFDGLTEITAMTSVFSNCESIQTIPADLFKDQAKVTNAQTCFNGCKSIETIPAGLFDAFTENTSFLSMFQNCTSLKSIPDKLFFNSTKVINIRLIFNGCSSLKTIGSQIFNFPNISSNNNATSIFKNCTSLETLPADLFSSFTGIVNYTSAFEGCTKLKTLPAGLFANSTNVTNFNKAFYGCTSLQSIPAGLFDNNKKVVNFGNTFGGCTALTGASPYTNVSGTDVYLYQRDTSNGFTKPTTTSGCFRDCAGLSDYAAIPATWK